MSQFVIIRASNPGFESRSRAHRRWPCGGDVRVEVLDTESDPPKIKQTVERNGKQVEVEVPDPFRIGQSSLREIKGDGCFTVLADFGTQVEQSSAALEEAKRQAADLSAEVSTLKIRIVELEDALRLARSEADAARAKAAEAESLLAAATAPQSEAEKAEHAKGKAAKAGK